MVHLGAEEGTIVRNLSQREDKRNSRTMEELEGQNRIPSFAIVSFNMYTLFSLSAKLSLFSSN